MKVGILSDSHGNTRAIDAMLAHPETRDIGLWFHAGDVVPDAEYLAMMADTEVVRVAGNCDWLMRASKTMKCVMWRDTGFS